MEPAGGRPRSTNSRFSESEKAFAGGVLFEILSTLQQAETNHRRRLKAGITESITE